MPEKAKAVPNRHLPPEVLIRTAERLFAIHGLDGVSLRQIAIEAGHRNPGAVQYHFGDKDGLVQAIVNYRLPWINQRRTQLLATLDSQHRSHDLKGLVEVLARPYLEMDPEAYYVQFLARLSPIDERMRSLYQSAGQLASASLSLTDRLDVALGSLPPGIRLNRMAMARSLLQGMIAGRPSFPSSGTPPVMTDELFAQELYDGLYAVFTAPHHMRWPDQQFTLRVIDGL
jgi:AcrR family transcriptional regulator